MFNIFLGFVVIGLLIFAMFKVGKIARVFIGLFTVIITVFGVMPMIVPMPMMSPSRTKEKNTYTLMQDDTSFNREVDEDEEYLRELEDRKKFREHMPAYNDEFNSSEDYELQLGYKEVKEKEEQLLHAVEIGTLDEESVKRMTAAMYAMVLTDEQKEKREELADKCVARYLEEYKNSTLDMNGRSFKRVFIDWDGNEIPVEDEFAYSDDLYNSDYTLGECLEEMFGYRNCAFYLELGLSYYSKLDEEYMIDSDSEILAIIPYIYEEAVVPLKYDNVAEQVIVELKDGREAYLKDTIISAKKFGESVKELVENGDTKTEFYGMSAGTVKKDDTDGFVQFKAIVANKGDELTNGMELEQYDKAVVVYDISSEILTGYTYIYRLELENNVDDE